MASTRGRQVVVPLTNKSGGAVAAGDVVIVDTSNDAAFTTTTTARVEVTVGIAQEAIASNATGRVLLSGYAALVNVPSSVTRGHYVETHTVAKQATGSGTRRSGSLGQFLTGGTTPTAMLWGNTDQTASVTSTSTYMGARATKNATQSINSATETAVTFPGADTFDTNSIHDPASNSSRMTVPTGGDGYWKASVSIEFAANATGYRYIFFKKNGSTEQEYAQADEADSGTAGMILHLSVTFQVVATDYVEVFAAQASGGALNLGTFCKFTFERIGV